MPSLTSSRRWPSAIGLGPAALLLAAAAHAFPPAPMHRVVGMVRTELGDPLNLTNAVVILETSTGLQSKAKVVPNIGRGRNYVLNVPMDAGLSQDNYRSDALRTAMSYRMKVQVGGVTYLPLETRITPATLGRPAQSTKLDLTLGEDADGDGIPDAWERALLAMMASSKTIRDIQPNDDADGDGISNLHEYVAGTFAFDPADGFRLEAKGTSTDGFTLEFLAIPGRRYTLQGSRDMQVWRTVGFQLAGDAASAGSRADFVSTKTQLLRVRVPATGAGDLQFFKAFVQ